MTAGKVTDLHPEPGPVPPYDDLEWTAERLPGSAALEPRWAVVGRIPGRPARIDVVTVTSVRRGGSARDLAEQIAEYLNGARADG